MKNELKKPKNFKSKIAKIGICIFGLIGGLAATFFLVPNRTKIINLGMPEEEPPAPETYFSRFVSKFTAGMEDEEAEAYPAISADFDGVEVSWPGNTISVGGNLKLSIANLNDISLSLDLDVVYNNKECDIALALVNKTVYFALKDLRLKQSFVDSDLEGVKDLGDVFDHFCEQFIDTENEDGLRINFPITNLVNDLLGGLDLTSLLAGGAGGMGLEVEEVEGDETVDINLGITMGGEEESEEEPTKLNIKIVLGKEKLDLRKVDLGTMKFGDLQVKGKLNCVTSKDVKILGLDDPNYPRKRGDFIEIINYSNWIDKIFNLLDTRQIGLDVSANLKMYEEGVPSNLGYVDLSADLDASELFDLHDLDLKKVIDGEAKIDSIYGPNGIEDGDNEITDLLNKFDFNVGLKLGNIVDGKRKEYSNLGLAYYTDEIGHNAGFLTFNEDNDNAVLRAKIDVQTINYLIGKVPELIETIEGKEVTKVKRDASEPEEEVGFFDFVTDSDLVKAIIDGHYEGVLDVLETLKSTESTIEVGLNLKSLGFGDNAKLKLVLDAGTDSVMPTNVISIKAENIKLNDLELDAEIATRPYSGSAIDKIETIKDKFDVIDFVPGVFNQVQNIISTEQAGIKLSGDILDSNKLGFDFEGWAQLNYTQKNGMGSIKFNEYKEKAGVVANDHQVDISIDDFDGDHANNNMLFEYSNPMLAAKEKEAKDKEPLRGKFTLKTFDDIIDLVMKLIEQKDRRFMKFLDDILTQLRASLIMKVIESKDYLQLTQSSLIQSIKQENEGQTLDIILSEQLIPLNLVKSPLHIQIEFGKDSNGDKNLKAINVIELDLGEKKVNAHIELADFNPEAENPVDVSKTNFMNFSDIAVLLEFGINTCELNCYHLKGKVKASALLIINANINVDFYITVHDEETKVYGKITNLPVILADAYTEFVFEPDHDASGNDIGGYFYMLRSEDHTIGSFNDKQYYYKASSGDFVDHILEYLLGSCLGYSSLTGLGNLDLGSGEAVNPLYQNMFTDTGFQYSHTEAQDKWDVGVDLGVITNNSSFSALEASITGSYIGDKGYLRSIHAETSIILIINVSADITLEDVNPDTYDWPASVEQRYQRIVGYYDTLSSANQAKAYNNYKNGYSCSLGTI